MKNSLCNSLVDLLHGNTHCNGLVSGVILQSGIGFLDLSLELRIGGLILQRFCSDHFHTLLGRFDVWHSHTSLISN